MSIATQGVYPTQRLPLHTQITTLLKNAPEHQIDGEIMAVIVPDTNRLGGGKIAAEVFKSLAGRRYDSVILIAPSHTGTFRRMTITRLDTYESPLGELVVDDSLRNELCDEDDDIYLDDQGHFHTEGIDVQLPFLQTVLEDDFTIVPIVMGEETPEFCHALGQAVGEIMYNRRTLVVACADILGGSEEALDEFKQHFENRDVSRLMTLLNTDELNVEGKGAVLVALIAALHRRATHAEILTINTPGPDCTGCLGAILWR